MLNMAVNRRRLIWESDRLGIEKLLEFNNTTRNLPNAE